MLFTVQLIGDAPLIMHAAIGLDPTTDVSRAINEITKKRASNITEPDRLRLRELECQRSIWWSATGERRPVVPQAALRSCIEAGARKLKQGPLVREGLVVQDVAFVYDEDRYGVTLEQLGLSAQFTTPVVVQRNRIMRTRAMFEQPWSVEATVYGDDELVDSVKLHTWLDIGGQRIGLGDWRPEKSGSSGRFHVDSLTTQ